MAVYHTKIKKKNIKHKLLVLLLTKNTQNYNLK